jgi:hypothetical protein
VIAIYCGLPGRSDRDRLGARSREQGAGCKEQGARSTEHGARSTEHGGARSEERGARKEERGARCKEQGARSEELTSSKPHTTINKHTPRIRLTRNLFAVEPPDRLSRTLRWKSRVASRWFGGPPRCLRVWRLEQTGARTGPNSSSPLQDPTSISAVPSSNSLAASFGAMSRCWCAIANRRRICR